MPVYLNGINDARARSALLLLLPQRRDRTETNGNLSRTYDLWLLRILLRAPLRVDGEISFLEGHILANLSESIRLA